jgi:ferredoxin
MSCGISIDAKTCIRCAACATVAPAHFRVGAGTAQVTRVPETLVERDACDSAADLCPTQAITVTGPRDALPPGALSKAPLFPTLLEVAEGVRWRVAELPRDRFKLELAPPELRELVRQMAFSEQATFSATQKFLQGFGDRGDFSEWVAVWFYEETRHPMVLLEWLALAGEPQGDGFVRDGRVSTPFMKSRIGTLVTNVISEVFAAASYLAVPYTAPEPLLKAIGRRICADEARHAASFYAYARQAIALAKDPMRERLDALKVVHFWLNENQAVSHPVNEMLMRVTEKGIGGELQLPKLESPRLRVLRAVGRLIGLPLDGPEQVSAQLFELTRQVHASAGV